MNPSEKYFDVVICGAGPAGSTCALALSESNLKVGLIDKSSFPRDKVCGDAIAAYARKVLYSIKPQFAAEFDTFNKGYAVTTYRLFAPNGKYVDVSSAESGMIARRYDWDDFLFQLAATQKNVSVILNTTVTHVERNADGTISLKAGHEHVKCKVIIGCDGAHSVVVKALASRQMDLKHHSAAVRAYFRNVQGMADRTFELHFNKDILPGYFWIFPLTDNMANVGLGCSSSHISNKKLNLRKIFDDILLNNPTLRSRFEGAEMISDVQGFGLPLGSRKTTISGDNFMLCGDAASLIDPLTGEGIGPAMVSGRYAGWHAAKCFEVGNFTAGFMKEYNKQVYAKFWSGYKKRYFIQQRIIPNPTLINGLINLANRSSVARHILSNIFA